MSVLRTPLRTLILLFLRVINGFALPSVTVGIDIVLPILHKKKPPKGNLKQSRSDTPRADASHPRRKIIERSDDRGSQAIARQGFYTKLFITKEENTHGCPLAPSDSEVMKWASPEGTGGAKRAGFLAFSSRSRLKDSCA